MQTTAFVCDRCGRVDRYPAPRGMMQTTCPVCGGSAWRHPFPTAAAGRRLSALLKRLEKDEEESGDAS